MGKKTDDVDDLLNGADIETEEKPAKKAKAAPAAKKAEDAPAKKVKAAPAAKKAAPAAKKVAPAAKKAKAKTDDEAAPVSESAIRKALLKVKKAVSYADFSEANGFNIRTVRRTARLMRDAGEIDLVREGQSVFIGPAV